MLRPNSRLARMHSNRFTLFVAVGSPVGRQGPSRLTGIRRPIRGSDDAHQRFAPADKTIGRHEFSETAQQRVLVTCGCHGRLVRPCRHWQQAASGTPLRNDTSPQKQATTKGVDDQNQKGYPKRFGIAVCNSVSTTQKTFRILARGHPVVGLDCDHGFRQEQSRFPQSQGLRHKLSPTSRLAPATSGASSREACSFRMRSRFAWRGYRPCSESSRYW